MAAPVTTAPAPPAAPPRGAAGRGRPGRLREAVTGWVFTTPNLVLLALFLFFPLGWTFVLSLQDAATFGPSEWIGLDNYTRLLGDDVFWRALWNNTVFTVATVPTAMAIGLGLAVLLNRALPARGVFRTAIYLPIVLSGLVTALIGSLVFEEVIGVANKALATLGMGPVSWQTDGTWAMVSIILVTLWIRVGFDMVIYLAGIQDVPAELYEAARIDGASGWQQFRHITVPMVRPATFFLLVMNVIYSFQVFDTVYVLTRGGPGYSTEMLSTYAFKYAFEQRDQGYGATIGVVLFLFTLVFTALQWRNRRDQAQGG